MKINLTKFKEDLESFLEEVEANQKDDASLLEKLAELEHEQWMTWAKDILEKENISEERSKRWKTLFVPYNKLNKDMQEEDKKWARKIINIIEKRKNGLD